MTILSLALDGSGPQGGIALLNDTTTIDTAFFPEGSGFGVTMMAQLESLMRQHRLTPADLNLMTVASGPGSFTGLRVALGLAKGIALVRRIPIIGLSTLFLAASMNRQGAPWILAIRDAGHHHLFYALYVRRDAALTEKIPPTMGRVEDLDSMLADQVPEESVTCCGPGLSLHGDHLRARLKERFCSPGSPLSQPPPDVLGRLGFDLWRQGLPPAPADFEPLYLRPPQAQTQLKERTEG
ncbi:MAG: tRNA (adenosine(37)-N6)-threonylcarbamoyltransferase complex dimerization subunit type 1 TsaB [Magnetococcales bacterium]|nr:tRNA (adenosine(37)-N6)-threonylcarbamoyltransferase complex dimerization subunit type 1 TsaB [Magnetococcales bacterium]